MRAETKTNTIFANSETWIDHRTETQPALSAVVVDADESRQQDNDDEQR